MLKLSVCAEMIFKEKDFLNRVDAIARAGFSAFEFWGWRSKDIQGLIERKKKYNLTISSICIDPSCAIVNPREKETFLKSVTESIEVAHKLGTSILIVTTGNEITDVARRKQHQSIVNSLKAAASLVEREEITIVVEPLNILVNHKGYYLSTSAEGFEIIKEVNSPRIKLLFDIYHQQVTEGNLIQNITENINLIGHFHAADVPGRHELGTGEINYCNVIQRIKETEYQGYIGLEFSPLKSSEEALKDCQEILKGICN